MAQDSPHLLETELARDLEGTIESDQDRFTITVTFDAPKHFETPKEVEIDQVHNELWMALLKRCIREG